MNADDAQSAAVARARRRLGRSETRLERARRLTAVALDAARSERDRIDFLRRAVGADLMTGREAAITLLRVGATPELASVCGSIIANTRGSEDDLPALQSLLATRPDPVIHGNVRASLDNITGQDLTESLVALAEAFDLHITTEQLNPNVLVPNARHGERLRRWSDKARARSVQLNRPGAFIESAVRLSEVLVELAVIATFSDADQAGVTAAELASLDDCLRDRPSLDVLLARPELTYRFPWFGSVVKLCRISERLVTHGPTSGHATVTDLVAAKRLLVVILTGWIDSMHQHYREPHD